MQREENIESQADRKLDARKKIMLGGLFVKAELDYMHPHDASTLYGMLLDCKKLLVAKPQMAVKWKEMGKELLVKS